MHASDVQITNPLLSCFLAVVAIDVDVDDD